MFNLAINIPNVNDATNFYRGTYPLSDIRKRCRFLTGITPTQWSEATIRMCDAVFFQRPYNDSHVHTAEMAKDVGRKIWVDYDDLLFDVPTDNPTYSQYMNKGIQDSIKKILQLADVVTVSTEFLKNKLLEHNKNIFVAPNAIDMDLGVIKNRKINSKKNKIISWRGSASHQRDLFTYARPILDASRDPLNKDWQWHFIGYNPWFVTDSMPHYQTFITKTMGPIEFHKHILNLNASALMVPLHDSPFNRSKSNIAWIESSFSGAVTIAPAWEEWKKPGVITYENEAQFIQALYAIITGEINIENTVMNSWNYIQENLTLQKVNEVRINVLCELFECDRKELGL